MTNHSKLPPSSAARRMACPGSRAMNEKYGRDEKSEAATEGDLAHELAAYYLKNMYKDFVDPKYTEEMREGAHYYAEIVTRFCPEKDIRHIEQRVNIFNIHPDMWGTPDAWGLDKLEEKPDDRYNLHVFDYKFGFTPVEAFENWQLLAYACGIIENYNADDIRGVYLHIIQPRDFTSGTKHKIWHLTLGELEVYKQRLVISEALAMDPRAKLKVSAECKYCPARYACPALKQAAFGATELAFRDAPQGLDPKKVGSELKFLHEARDLLDYRITALETEVEHLLRNGTPVDHYQLEAKYGNLTWNTDKKELLALGDVLGIKLLKEDIITPTQALKLGMDESIVKSYSERKQSLKLSKIDLTKSKEVFKK